jgi:hypothetical protein
MLEIEEERFQRLVVEVIRRLTVRLREHGRRGTLIAVFTGATAGFQEAVQLVRNLILDGFHIQVAFSAAAERLYGQVLRDQLGGFPHLEAVPESGWLLGLKKADAVVVPLLSVNSLSKLALLIADNLPSNLLLHALFAGKAVVAANNGVDPDGSGRAELGFNREASGLRGALLQRLQTVAGYGCRLVDISEVRGIVDSVSAGYADASQTYAEPGPPGLAEGFASKRCLITAAEIRRAHHLKQGVRLARRTLITPLARELAARYGVDILEHESF